MRLDQFSAPDRQYLSDPDILTNHPAHLTDGWVLTIKAYSILGRISTFNRRLELHRRAEVSRGKRDESELFYPLPMTCDHERLKLGFVQFLNASSSPDILASSQFKTLDSNIACASCDVASGSI